MSLLRYFGFNHGNALLRLQSGITGIAYPAEGVLSCFAGPPEASAAPDPTADCIWHDYAGNPFTKMHAVGKPYITMQAIG